MQQPTRWNRIQDIVTYMVLGLCTIVFVVMVIGTCGALLGKSAAGKRDFVAYWASGQLLTHHVDPYDSVAVLNVQRTANYPPKLPALIMRNPPTALLLALPLGLFHPQAGELLWVLFLVLAWVASVQLVWEMHGRPEGHLRLLGYTFGPAMVCVVTGQSALFVLIGLVLFLWLRRSKPFLAGFALWLCMLKPHLFVPFGVVLALWIITTNSYRIVLGLAVALGISNAIAVFFDPMIWRHYGQMLRSDQVAMTPVPCLSVGLRRAISPHSTWIEFVPVVLGCLWAIVYFQRYRGTWNWMEHGSLLLLVSVVVAPYAWLTDQSVVIPAMLHAAHCTRSRNIFAVLVVASAIIEVGIFNGVQPFHSFLYIWTAPAWLVWYVWAVRSKPEVEGDVGIDHVALEPSS